MNGIRLLLLIASAGQVAAGSERDFGWQISPEDGVLEYIVQVSPTEASQMQANHLENPSDIPPELVGRARRVVIRIGNDVLPRTPSLAEIAKMPRFNSLSDVASALQPGRIAEVESDAVRNVQGSGPPRLPDLSGFPGTSSSNAIDQASAAARGGAGQSLSDSLSNRFLNDARGSEVPSLNPGTGQGSNLPGATHSGGGLAGAGLPGTGRPGTAAGQTGLSSKFENTGGANAQLPASPQWTNPQGPTQRTADARSSLGAGQAAASLGAGMGQPSYGIPSSQTPTPGFGSTPGVGAGLTGNVAGQAAVGRQNGGLAAGLGGRGYGNAAINARGTRRGNLGYGQGGYGREGYGGEGYSGEGYGSPRAGYGQGGYAGGADGYGAGGYLGVGRRPANRRDRVTQIASNSRLPTGDPARDSLLGDSQTGKSDATTNGGQDSPSDDVGVGTSGNGSQGTGSASPPNSTTAVGLLQIFFLLSLVVNFYLGILIRKLLARYRSLLSNVRGSAA